MSDGPYLKELRRQIRQATILLWVFGLLFLALLSLPFVAYYLSR